MKSVISFWIPDQVGNDKLEECEKMNKKKEIKYLAIIKDAWQIIWNNKYLWWFGFFIALGGGGSSNFQLPMNNNGKWEEKTKAGKEEILSFINGHFEWIAAGLIILTAIAIALLVLRIISQAAIIKSVSSIKKGGKSNFSIGFKKGRKYFWKLLAIDLILGFFTFGILIVLFLPVVFLFHVKSYIAASLLLILAILIFIPLIILVSFLKKYAYFYLVLAKSGIKSSIENAYQVFRKNTLPSLIMALLLLAIGIIAGIAIIMLILPLALVFILIGLVLYFILAKVGIFITAVLGILIFILIAFLLSSAVTAFRQTAWLLFFQEIAALKSEEVGSELENKIAEEKVPGMEKA